MNAMRLTIAAAFVFAQAALCQAPPQMPKPGPEHQRLAYFIGTWAHEGEMKASPFGPDWKVYRDGSQ